MLEKQLMPTDKYQIRLLSIAEEDFTEIISFIAADNPTAADAIANKIEKNLELLSENPKLGRIPRDEEIRNLGYRYLIVQNYLIFYTVEERTIFVHRILHGARNYKSLL
ncbi:MAG: type II toxin-antitoxin system RelE/ParE family toxin [Ignavibacteria bacterium]|nr:type II toxin-antitoxin system RelE/ParE family toxin [Ignavibacteria bacterium]